MNSAFGANLIGRGAELQTLRDLMQRAGRGVGTVALVEGEPGIGKSRLTEAALAEARQTEFQVFRVDCDELGRTRPFGSLASALGIVATSADSNRAAIAAVLDGTTSSSFIPAEASPAMQFWIIEAAGALVERAASDGPLVLVIEDLHWSDASTLAALRSIVRRVRRLPVLVLGTFRSGYETRDLHRVVNHLHREGGAVVELGPLDEVAVAALAADALGVEPSPAVLARLQGAAGNPLFITEYLRALIDGGAIDSERARTEDLAGHIPLEFRRTVLRGLAQLTDETNHVLRLAAVLGHSFSPSELSAGLGSAWTQIAPAFQQALTTGVVVERGDRLAFRHDLVRDAIYEHIPAAVRRQLHKEIGRALAVAGSPPLDVAHHLGIGADEGDVEAAEWLRKAATAAAPRSPAVAVELLERAMALLDDSCPERAGLMAELVSALAWSGRLVEAETLSREVLALRPDAQVTGRLRCGLVHALTWQGRPTEALRHAAVRGDEEMSEWDRVLLLAQASVACLFAFDLRAAGDRAAQAEREATALGHELALCHALTVRAWVASFLGHPEEAIEFNRRAIDVADRSDRPEVQLAHPRFFAGMPLVNIDRLDEAELVLQTGRRTAEAMGLVWCLPLYHAHLGGKRFIAGDWDGAVAELEAGLTIADEVGMSVGIMTAAAAWLTVIQVHRNDIEGAEQTLVQAFRRLTDTGAKAGMHLLNWARALTIEATGDTGGALAVLQDAWETYMAGGNTSDRWSAITLVRLCMKAGIPERAEALLPIVDRQAATLGSASMRGQAFHCRGLVEQSAATLVAAVAAYRQSPRPLDLASACEDAGVHLSYAGRLPEAIELLEEALALYDDLGAVRDAGRVRSVLRECGVVMGVRGPHTKADAGWESLTKAELKVVDLVAQRLSNPEVAERLFLSRHTVESHLKRVYRKLGLSSRVELAAEAARHS